MTHQPPRPADSIGPPVTTRDLMTDAEFEALMAEHGPTYAGWELFDRWLTAWRDAHPDDAREELELSYVYADWPDDRDIAEGPPS